VNGGNFAQAVFLLQPRREIDRQTF
jgi:hypothetical protein